MYAYYGNRRTNKIIGRTLKWQFRLEVHYSRKNKNNFVQKASIFVIAIIFLNKIESALKNFRY